MSDNWDDKSAKALYEIARNANHSDERKRAIAQLGNRARQGSDDAVWALKKIARNANFSDEREKAIDELGK